jgi:TetR/AcrR family transcriptional regulator, cholesterol catabolism regulator
MDDFARGLGVSKKTLYKYVSDKRDLVRKAFAMQGEEKHRMMAEVASIGDNAIDAELVIMRQMHATLSEMHPSVMLDLQKYYNQDIEELIAHRDEAILHGVERNVVRGIREGVYRDDIDPKTIAQLMVALIGGIQSIASASEIARPFHQLFLETFSYHIRGIASPKGLAYLSVQIAEEKIKA